MNAVLALEDGTWFRGVAAGATGDTRRRSRVQHEHDRLSGSADRSLLRRTDRDDDGAADRQLRRRDRRRRVAAAARGRLRHARGVAGREQLARGRHAARLSRRNHIVAIADIDTRALTRVLRSAGVMRGVIATGQVDPDDLVEKARAIPQMEGADLVKDVTCARAVRLDAAAATKPDEFGIAPERRARSGRCGSPPTTSA